MKVKLIYNLGFKIINMDWKCYLDMVILKEKLSNKEDVFVAHCTSLGITSQGSTIEEATKNIKEAIDLYLEELAEKYIITLTLN